MILEDVNNLWGYIYNRIMTCSHKEEILIENRNIKRQLYYYKKHVNYHYNKEVVERWRL